MGLGRGGVGGLEQRTHPCNQYRMRMRAGCRSSLTSPVLRPGTHLRSVEVTLTVATTHLPWSFSYSHSRVSLHTVARKVDRATFDRAVWMREDAK